MSNETTQPPAPDAGADASTPPVAAATAPKPQAEPAPSPAAAAAAAARAEMNDGAAPVHPELEALALQLRVDELEGQIKDLTERLLRSHADMDNMRKRTEREKADTAKYAVTKFAQDMVLVADNLRRAIAASAPGEGAALESESAQQKALREGVVLTDQELTKALERNGISRITPAGEPFNPHLHQAVMEREDKSVAAGTVLQVFQDGYIIGDRVLRPAMVQVARGGFKPVREPASTQASAAEATPATGETPAASGAAGEGPTSAG